MSMMEDEGRRTKKWVWGCTGGCLGFLVIVGLGIYLMVWYIKRPMPVVPAEAFIGPETSSFLILRVEPGDELMTTAVARMMLDARLIERLPSKEGAGPQMNMERSRELIRTAAPVQTVLVLSASEDAKRLSGGAALAVRGFFRIFSWQFSNMLSSRANSTRYKGATLASINDESYGGVRGNNFMYATSESVMRGWVDRIADYRRQAEQAPEGEEPKVRLTGSPALKSAYQRLDAAQPVRLAVDNSRGELGAFANLLEKETQKTFRDLGLASDRIETVSAQIAPEQAPRAPVTAFIKCADSDFAESLRERLQMAVEEVGEQLPVKDVEFSLQEEDLLEVRGTIPDLPAQAGRLARYATRKLETKMKARERAAEPKQEPEPATEQPEQPSEAGPEEPAQPGETDEQPAAASP